MLKVFVVLMMIIYTPVKAQELIGVVRDVMTRLPIANAQVITSKETIITDFNGRFMLSNLKIGDRLAIRIMGYETSEIAIKKLNDTITIYLRQTAIALSEVNIKTKRNYKLDSLSLRKEYANAFEYKGPGFTDMFVERDPDYNSPFGFTNPKSTASILSLNVLPLLRLMGKKKVINTRLKQTLLRDEELNYVDHVFSKEKVTLITALEGEQLIKFMNLYRPSILSLKKMTGYELTIYIKKSYAEFLKTHN